MDTKTNLHEVDVRRHTLLLVDDSPVNLGVVVENLELQGYEVLVALDGEEALRRAQDTQPDIILLDVMMPGMDGFEVCRRLKADPCTSGIPVMFMTSLGRLEDKIDGFAAGAVDYVTKPLQMDELRARVGVHLNLRDLQRQLGEQNRELQREIEQRMEIERLMKQERNMLRAFLRAMPAMAWMKDMAGRYMICNPLLERLFGVPEAEITGKTDFDFMGDEEARFCRDSDSETIWSGAPSRSEEWVTFAGEGRRALFEIVKAPVLDAQGVAAGVIGVAYDITERKRMQELLERREREFRTLAENSPDVIVRYDRECRFAYANPNFERMMGRPLEALLGKRPQEVPGLPEAEFFQRRVAEVIETGRPDELEHRVRTPDGSSIWMLVSMTPERDAAGRIVHVQVLSRNISALKEAEFSLEESRARLRQLLARQEDSHEQVRKRLSWEMHEDLLQMLSAMQMYSTLLQTSSAEAGGATQQALAALMSSLGKSIKLVREMALSLRPAVLNLGLVAALEWLVEGFVRKQELACNLELGKGFMAPDEKSGLLAFRIVEEALAFSAKPPFASHLDIRLESAEGGCLLTIRDRSMGSGEVVPEEQFLNLFGLQERVIAMGGEMIVFGEPGHGLIIEAQIPRQPAGAAGAFHEWGK